jgi:hypothetical protein
VTRYAADVPWPERYERNVRIVELFAEGKSCNAIARVVGIHYSAVANVLRGAGLDPAPHHDLLPVEVDGGGHERFGGSHRAPRGRLRAENPG